MILSIFPSKTTDILVVFFTISFDIFCCQSYDIMNDDKWIFFIILIVIHFHKTKQSDQDSFSKEIKESLADEIEPFFFIDFESVHSCHLTKDLSNYLLCDNGSFLFFECMTHLSK